MTSAVLILGFLLGLFASHVRYRSSPIIKDFVVFSKFLKNSFVIQNNSVILSKQIIAKILVNNLNFNPLNILTFAFFSNLFTLFSLFYQQSY